MKSFTKYLFLIFFIFITTEMTAQFNVLEKVKKKVNKTVEKNIDKAIDETVDGAEKEIKKGPAEKKEDNGDENTDKKPNQNEENVEDATTEEKFKVWRKYDFVPGEKIIFSDNLADEEVGEFPSKWDLLYGNSEVVTLGNEKVIGLIANRSQITPYMEEEDFLPEVFTIEFDFYYYGKYNEAYTLHLGTHGFQVDIRPHKVSLKNFNGEPGEGAKDPGWHHFALSFNKRALKAYYDQTRVLNIPRLKTKPTKFSISALSHGKNNGDFAILRNIRVAEGGVKLYDRVMTDGKFVTRGILFDVNKSSIKPESMGVINKVVKMMNEHKDLNFSIEGHTDSDGDDASNQTLSEARASSVKNVLVNQGIDESRLSTKGFGESIPVDDNKTSVGKANNRRVEFVKI